MHDPIPIAIFAFFTYLGFLSLTAAYVTAQAIIGHCLGLIVEKVSIGYDVPESLRLRIRGRYWHWQIGLLLIGGYTKFKNSDVPSMDVRSDDRARSVDDSWNASEMTHLENAGSFEAATLGRRIVILLVGPFTSLIIGLFAIGLGCWVDPQRSLRWTTDPGRKLTASAVPGLVISEQPPSFLGQLQTALSVFSEGFQRLALFQPLDGWCGLVGWMTTGGTVGRTSSGTWLTFIGITGLINGIANLLPIGGLNGGHILLNIIGGFSTRQSVKRLEYRFTLVGFLWLLTAFGRSIIADIIWMVG